MLGLCFFIVGYVRVRKDLRCTSAPCPACSLSPSSSLSRNPAHDSLSAFLASTAWFSLRPPPPDFPNSSRDETHLIAPLCSPVWQNRNRTSFNVCENAYLADIFLFFFGSEDFLCS